MPAISNSELEQIARANYNRMAAHYWHAGFWAKTWEEIGEGEREAWRRTAGKSIQEFILAHFYEMKKGA